MLKKGERICPVCGKKLLLRAPSNRDADGIDIKEGYPPAAVRTKWSIMPYTVYPHRDHNLVTRKGGVPRYVSSNFIQKNLKLDGFWLYNTLNVFFCEECSSRLSLNFNPGGLDILLVMMIIVSPLLAVGVFSPSLFALWWVIVPLALFAAVFLGWVGCMVWAKLYLSNFVPVDEYDALIIPTTELTLSPEGLKKQFLHESNIFTVQLSQQKFHLYLANKTDKVLAFSVCGTDGEQKRFVSLLERSGAESLDLTFEGKSAGSARVVGFSYPEIEEEK